MDRREFQKVSLGALSSLAFSSFAAIPALSQDHDRQAARAEAGAQFSVMLWTLPKTLTFPQQLDIVADAGYTSVEVGNQYEKWTDEEWTTNLAWLQKRHLSVDSAVPGRNPLADHGKRDALKSGLEKAIPGAKRLGCNQFIYTAYNRVQGQSLEEQRSAIVDTLKYAADLLEKDQIQIVLEPIDLLEHKEEAVTSVEEAFNITRLVNSPRIKVLYDFYHEQRQAGNLIEKLTRNIDQVGLVHVADVPGRHQPGTGEMNWNNIYRELGHLRYNRVICMEFSAQGDPMTTLRKAREEAIAAMKIG
jgi:hydroxypyruvate isomerase